jgi:beta-glucosidase-like glycosyl hydrolase
MVSHCNYVHLQDDRLPASLSSQIVNDLLRNGMGYDGLVITDSLDMGSVIRHVGPPQVAELALKAGCDVMLYTEFSRRFVESFESLLAMCLSGQVSEARLRRSTERRARLVKRLTMVRSQPSELEVESYSTLKARIAAQAIEIHDDREILPLDRPQITMVSTSPGIGEKMEAYTLTPEGIDRTTGLPAATVILWLMEPLHMKVSVEDLKQLIRQGKRSILITAYEELRRLLPRSDVTIIAHDTSPDAEAAILRSLFGQLPHDE